MNVWPFNAEHTDTFIAAQIIFSVLAVIAAAGLQRLIAELIDPIEDEGLSAALTGVIERWLLG